MKASLDREVDIYLTLARQTRGYSYDKARLVSATMSPPTTRPKGTAVVKLKVIVPDAAFDPAAIPALVADIPLDMIVPPLNELEAIPEDANEGRA